MVHWSYYNTVVCRPVHMEYSSCSHTPNFELVCLEHVKNKHKHKPHRKVCKTVAHGQYNVIPSVTVPDCRTQVYTHLTSSLPSYTAWSQRQACVCGFPMAVLGSAVDETRTRDLSIKVPRSNNWTIPRLHAEKRCRDKVLSNGTCKHRH